MARVVTTYTASSVPAFRSVGRLGVLAALGRSRRRLAELDEHLLRDIGLTESEARQEAERPFWDAPDHWRL